IVCGIGLSFGATNSYITSEMTYRTNYIRLDMKFNVSEPPLFWCPVALKMPLCKGQEVRIYCANHEGAKFVTYGKNSVTKFYHFGPEGRYTEHHRNLLIESENPDCFYCWLNTTQGQIRASPPFVPIYYDCSGTAKIGDPKKREHLVKVGDDVKLKCVGK